MAEQFRARDVGGSGRTQLSPEGWAQQGVVIGDRYCYAWEGAVTTAATSLKFYEPVRTLVVWSPVAVYVARTALALDVAGNAKSRDSRLLVPANTLRELPWYYDEVSVKAASGAGECYMEGKL